MGGTKGYRSYRGRTSKAKIALAVVLVLVILASAGVMWAQEYVVYDETGRPSVVWPWQEAPSQDTPQTQLQEVEVTIQEPETPRLAAMSASEMPLTLSGWQDARLEAAALPDAPEWNAAAVTLKDAGGRIYFPAASAAPGTAETAEDTAEALAALAGSEYHSIARMSCFLDPIAARADVEGAGLKNTGGFIFYDGNNLNWLDPGKPAARQYLCALAEEIAAMGFDELLLTDLGYPTEGKLDKIDYGTADSASARRENVRLFLEELRAALAEYGAAISVELPAEVIRAGADDAAGLALTDIAPLVDRIYAVTTAEEAPALAAAVTAAGAGTDFAAELAAYDPAFAGSCLILGE